jgi:hypothetical protein
VSRHARVPPTPTYRRLRPGARVLALVADPRDPGLTPAEAELVAARAESNLYRPCPACGAPNPLPEIVEPGTVRQVGVAHEAGCLVADTHFRAVIESFRARHGRLPQQMAIVCQVRPDWTLEPVEVAA